MNKRFPAIGMLTLGLICGCELGPKSSRGFTLPDGNADRGSAIYVELQCHACHKVAGIEQLAAEGEAPEMSVELGGEVSRIATYGELVTSIINPSHRLAAGFSPAEPAANGDSPMRNYNDVMTVTQLVDLVAFLQSQYTLKEYEPTYYPPYGY